MSLGPFGNDVLPNVDFDYSGNAKKKKISPTTGSGGFDFRLKTDGRAMSWGPGALSWCDNIRGPPFLSFLRLYSPKCFTWHFREFRINKPIRRSACERSTVPRISTNAINMAAFAFWNSPHDQNAVTEKCREMKINTVYRFRTDTRLKITITE